jgi:hypothetical protein
MQTPLSWPGLIGPSMKEARVSVVYWMAGSSPAMTMGGDDGDGQI